MTKEEISKKILMVKDSETFTQNESLFPYLKKMYKAGQKHISIKENDKTRVFNLSDTSFHSGHAFQPGHDSYTLTELNLHTL